MKLSRQLVKNIIEGAVFASPMPLGLEEIAVLFDDDEKLSRKELQSLIKELQTEYALRALELVEVASGYRFQVRAQFSPWISKMWPEKPPRLSRAPRVCRRDSRQGRPGRAHRSAATGRRVVC